MSVNINHQLEQVNNLKITPVGTGATVGSAGIVTYYGDGSNITGISTLNIVNYSAVVEEEVVVMLPLLMDWTVFSSSVVTLMTLRLPVI